MVNVNLVRKPGVDENWEPPTQYANRLINVNLVGKEFAPMDNYNVDEHIVGLIMAHQYSMKKGIEIFVDRSEKVLLKELK